MAALLDFLDMGGYAAFVWPAYGLAALVMTALALDSVRKLRRSRRRLQDLGAEAGRGRASGTKPD